MDKLSTLAAANQQRAQEVIRDSGIESIWRSVGAEPHLVGSLRTGLLITHRDIDFHIYSSPLRVADSFAAMARLAENSRIRRIEYGNLLDTSEECLEWHAWYADADDQLWQIDMIHMPKGSAYDGYFERVADRIAAVPAGFHATAGTAHCPVAAMEDPSRRLYAVQFHPEVTHTVKGREILQRFVLDICKCKPDWIMGDYAKEAVEKIRAEVGDEEVILGLSGGVDSSVTAALIHRAIGQRLTCVFVDNGLLRKNEREQVRETFEKNMGLKLIVVDAIDRFMNALAGVSDPEQKRKIIGREFVNVFQEEAAKIKNAKWLAQGTIYPDVIESAGAKTKKAKVIKSHHNVGGLPDTLHLKLLEPLRSLFKDEVRELGIALGLPAEMVYRHPFPGPGLGVRILGEVKREYADLLREADAIFIEELRKADLYDKVSQAFVVFLPVKSVGVMGDGRTYEWVVSLRSVETSDFMTAKWSELPYDLLGRVSNRIINEVRGINRVVYDVSGKPPATIEWE